MKLFLLLSIPSIILAKKEETGKKKININKEHLAFDYVQLFGVWYDIFSDTEMDFQYFTAHDLDNNKKLDGLELFIALDHEFKHEEEHENKDTEAEVDAIFSEFDSNNDGFLDYREFRLVQKERTDTNKITHIENTKEL